MTIVGWFEIIDVLILINIFKPFVQFFLFIIFNYLIRSYILNADVIYLIPIF